MVKNNDTHTRAHPHRFARFAQISSLNREKNLQLTKILTVLSEVSEMFLLEVAPFNPNIMFQVLELFLAKTQIIFNFFLTDSFVSVFLISVVPVQQCTFFNDFHWELDPFSSH